MTLKRNRAKQTLSLKDRLANYAKQARGQARKLPDGEEREEWLRKARDAEVAAQVDDWASKRLVFEKPE
jgi:hypothetical protein